MLCCQAIRGNPTARNQPDFSHGLGRLMDNLDVVSAIERLQKMSVEGQGRRFNSPEF